MIIERNFAEFVVFKEDSILTALNKINANRSRLIFAVSESGILEGILTDGDFRRWITSTVNIDVNVSIESIVNNDFCSAHIDSKLTEIDKLFSKKITVIPLVNDNFQLVGVALPWRTRFDIGKKTISEDSPVFIIAEIGNNHNGSLNLAKKLVDEAIKSGADCAKFQMRDLESLYINFGNTKDASIDLGTQYTLDLLSKMQLSDEEMVEIFNYCNDKDIIPLCTPWDLNSLAKLENYGMLAYKVSSADFTNYELIEAVAATGKPMICSTGMASEREVLEGISLIQSTGAPHVLLHCNSTYPAPFKDVNLNYIRHLKKSSGGLVGYSGHERDINVAVAAVAVGAKVIEKHFTLDNLMEGNDHKVSLMPKEFSLMVEGIRQVEEAMGFNVKRELSQGEMMNRENLAKSLVAAINISAGSVVTEEMITIKSPGQGLQPNRKKELLGKTVFLDKQVGDFFYNSDLGEDKIIPRDYQFKFKWGVPARYHDLNHLITLSNFDLVEIHLSYKDMELDFSDYLKDSYDMDLIVHAPELFAGDLTLDLCSENQTYRDKSIIEMQRVIDLTRKLTPYFSKAKRTRIVTNVGGYTNDRHVDASKLETLYRLLENSLDQLDMTGVEVIPQTMPPFPWHFGGQQFHNLFMDPENIALFCKKNNMRICLDLSHSKLACNYFKWSFSDFVKKVGPFTSHLHIADASGVDGEGLQIGDGDIDWSGLWEIINLYATNTSFIPEIWQGHKDNGSGMWKALAKLEGISDKFL
jgi:sialic acid synthase SpsE/sugar phosphate isomerase/epimerase